MNRPQIPFALKAVAALTMLDGLYYLVSILVTGHFDLAVLEIGVGLGLLRFYRWARVLTFLSLAIEISLTSIGVVAALFVRKPVSFDPFGWHAGHISGPFLFFYMTFWLLLALWKWRALARPEIKALFGRTPRFHSRSAALTT